MKATGEETYRYTEGVPDRYRPDMVGVDPNVGQEERETTIIFNDRDDMAEIESGQKVVIRYLLAHPDFEVQEVSWLGDRIVGLSGRLSKRHIRITAKARRRFYSGFSRRGRRNVT